MALLSSTMKTALVTGATGFVGHHLVSRLVSRGYKVKVLVRNPLNTHFSPEIDGQLIKLKGDITKFSDVLSSIESCDVVYHLAGHIAYKKEDYQLMEQVNVKGTQHVVDACVTHNTPKLIHMSSVVAVGSSFDKTVLNEDANYNMSPYHLGYFETKRDAEKKVIEGVVGQKLNASIINPSTIYGAGDATKGSRKTQLKVAQGKFPFYSGGGVNVVHIDDVIEALLKAEEVGLPGRRYIIAGENITIKQLFHKIAAAANVKQPTIYLPFGLIRSMGFLSQYLEPRGIKLPVNSETAMTSTMYHWYSSQRAQQELGISFKSADLAIGASVQWMRENGILK